MRRLTKKRLPFLVLIVVHFMLLGREFFKTKEKKQLYVLLLSQIGLAYIFEYFVLILGKSYVYKPRFSRKSYIDNVIGSVFSQSVFVPIASIILAQRQSGWRERIFVATAFMGVEWFFIKKKVYKLNWWKPWYTGLLLPLYFKWGQWWKKLLQQENSIARHLSFFFCIWVTGMNSLYLVAVIRNYKFGFGKKHTWREHFIVAPIFSFILSFLATIGVNRFPRIGPIIMYLEAIIVDVIFLKMGLIHSRFTYPPENMVGHLIMATLTKVYHNWIYRNTSETKKSP